MGETQEHTNVNTSNIRKLEIKIPAAKDGISIAELYSKKDQYSGKKVRISGQVTKFNAEIMKKNWVHIQDGSESNGKFDLTITTSDKAQVGDTLTFEGEIELDKDFGYGYFYDLIMVDAKIAK